MVVSMPIFLLLGALPVTFQCDDNRRVVSSKESKTLTGWATPETETSSITKTNRILLVPKIIEPKSPLVPQPNFQYE